MEEFLQNLLYAVITAAVPVITTYTVKYLKSVFEKVEVESNLAVVNDTIEKAQTLVSDVVIKVSQTYVDSLKASGKFDARAQQLAFNTAKKEVLLLMDDATKEVIVSLYADLDKWLKVQIEASVKKMK